MDNEVSGQGNQYDYGFRIYNPRLGKFLSVDPLTKSYAMLTPYQFASNTPIMADDLDGLEAHVVIYDHYHGKDEPEISIVYNKDLDYPGGVYTVHNYYNESNDFIEGYTYGSANYSEFPQYFKEKSEYNNLKANFTATLTGGSTSLSAKLFGFKLGVEMATGSEFGEIDIIGIRDNKFIIGGYNLKFRDNEGNFTVGFAENQKQRHFAKIEMLVGNFGLETDERVNAETGESTKKSHQYEVGLGAFTLEKLYNDDGSYQNDIAIGIAAKAGVFLGFEVEGEIRIEDAKSKPKKAAIINE